ncbi:uncharacterized protein LOC110263196 [Arachis ipaensis]|uniref:uncharacterized protein LOC110263196 n=1 Tax=Arachis ipaensis TaxID=130454 RepID=UPI000A2B9660|nr:uncharacterized protein LOC110263196 [Arachis ipaensis]
MITSTELQWRQESEQELALRKSKQRIHILKSYLDELNNESYLSGEEEEESSYEFTSDTKKYLYATAVEVLISGNHDQGQNNKHTIFHNISSTKKKRCCTYCEVKQGSSPQSSQTVYVRLYATAEGTKEKILLSINSKPNSLYMNILFKEESNK